jgi:hypothetical protein
MELQRTIPVSSYVYDERRSSYFGRYDYKGKYLVVWIRRDVSTKFGPGTVKLVFLPLTAGWIISDEAFFENHRL